MKKVIVILLLGVAQLCLFFPLKSVQYGSETAVSMQPNAYFPSSDTDNKMLAFGWFRNGYTLQDMSTSCTFDSAFPVSGDVNMNGGTIYLTSDLHLENITTLENLGKTFANGHIITMDSSVEKLINSKINTKFVDVDLSIASDLEISTTLFFEGNCNVDAQNRRIILDPNIEIVVGKNSTLTIQNMQLNGVQRYNIRCVDGTGTIILDNSSFYLDQDYNFTVGSLQMLNNVDLSGPYTFFYDSSQSLTIHSTSHCNISDGATLGVRVNSPAYGKKFIWFEDNTSEIEVENSSIQIGSAGILLTRGTIIFDGAINVQTNSTSTANGLIFGTGMAADDIIVKFNPASKVNFNNSPLTYNLTNPNNFQSASNFSTVIRGPLSCFYIKNDILFSNITISVNPTSTILVAPGKLVEYDNCTLELPSTEFLISGARFDTYTSLLAGNNEIFISNGVMPLYTLVQNSGNYIQGNGDVNGAIILYDNNAQLTFALNGQLQNYVALNGGTINLARDLELTHGNIFWGNGMVNISTYNLSLGSNDQEWSDSIYWDSDTGSIKLNSDIYLSGTWTFSGNCTINGNNNILQLDPAAAIIVERGSTLNLNNIQIYGIQNSNLRCSDNAGTISLDAATFIFSNDYTFGTGSLTFDNLVQFIGGPFTFTYATDQVSTINSGAILYIGEYMTLNYAPKSTAKKLIQFGCPGSQLTLDMATLNTTCTGIQLTTGVLQINGYCHIANDGTCGAEGIVIGDGISAQNDLTIQIADASCLELTSGCMVMKNLN